MPHWKLTTHDETALLILGETVLADDRHYADFAEDIDERGPLFKRLYDADAGDIVSLSLGALYQLKNTCLDVLKRLDREDAARVDLAPIAYVLHKSYYLLDIPVQQDGRHLFYASLAKEPFRQSTLVLCAARDGFTLRLQHEVKRLLAHDAVLEACYIPRRTAGNLRRAVDIARLHAIPDQSDESWFMTRDNLEDLKRLLCNLKERAASDSRFAPYRTTELDDITRQVVRQ